MGWVPSGQVCQFLGGQPQPCHPGLLRCAHRNRGFPATCACQNQANLYKFGPLLEYEMKKKYLRLFTKTIYKSLWGYLNSPVKISKLPIL